MKKYPEIGITMIGASGTGKTCYLYAMADAMKHGASKFRFEARPAECADALMDKWDEILAGKWPEGTSDSTEYEFSCAYAFRTLAIFRWHDYRGGILTRREDREEREEFYEKMNDSGCLVACIDAKAIQGAMRNDAKCRRLFDVYLDCLQEYRDDNNSTIPVVLTITKADLLKPGEFDMAVDLLTTKLMVPLFAAEDDGDGWFVAIAPVTLGKDLSNDKMKVNGMIEPSNVHAPVLVAVKCLLTDIVLSKIKEKNSLHAEIQNNEIALSHNADRSRWDKFMNGDPQEEIELILNTLKSSSSALDKEIHGLEADIKRVQDEIDKCQCVIFNNGMRLN